MVDLKTPDKGTAPLGCTPLGCNLLSTGCMYSTYIIMYQSIIYHPTNTQSNSITSNQCQDKPCVYSYWSIPYYLPVPTMCIHTVLTIQPCICTCCTYQSTLINTLYHPTMHMYMLYLPVYPNQYPNQYPISSNHVCTVLTIQPCICTCSTLINHPTMCVHVVLTSLPQIPGIAPVAFSLMRASIIWPLQRVYSA